MKANHCVNIVRVGRILPHPNADKLEITLIEGYQVVTGKGNFVEGDLAVYIPPDSVVPQTEPFKFIWQDYVGIDGTVPEKRRRITVKRLRKEYSEGLLMPLADLNLLPAMGDDAGCSSNAPYAVTVGENVADLLGITHYVPEFDRESTKADTASMPRSRYPKSLRGWFYWSMGKLGLRWGRRALALEVAFDFPVYDVDALKNHKDWIAPGDMVHVTEKIHGSNARYVVIDGVQYCGSRTQWKADGPNVWWNAYHQHPEIGVWCQENPGKVLYGEVGPTQKGFRYGAGDGDTFFFAFDVYNPDAGWTWPGNEGFMLTVPTLYVGPFNDSVLSLVDGPSVVPGAKHIREGVVIRQRPRGTTLKVVSNPFLEKDGQQ